VLVEPAEHNGSGVGQVGKLLGSQMGLVDVDLPESEDEEY
jgi:hypothetical protein